MFKAVLWDLGGVILTSPFEAFARYERANGLPDGFLRSVNSVDPHGNAWARLERNELRTSEFDVAFAAESRQLGHVVPGRDVLELLAGGHVPGWWRRSTWSRPGYARVPDEQRVRRRSGRPAIADVMARFDVVVESSEGGRAQAEPRFYEIACDCRGSAPACVTSTTSASTSSWRGRWA